MILFITAVWHCCYFFSFVTQQIHSTEKNFETACSLLEAGVEFAAIAKSEYTGLLFMLSKGMVS